MVMWWKPAQRGTLMLYHTVDVWHICSKVIVVWNWTWVTLLNYHYHYLMLLQICLIPSIFLFLSFFHCLPLLFHTLPLSLSFSLFLFHTLPPSISLSLSLFLSLFFILSLPLSLFFSCSVLSNSSARTYSVNLLHVDDSWQLFLLRHCWVRKECLLRDDILWAICSDMYCLRRSRRDKPIPQDYSILFFVLIQFLIQFYYLLSVIFNASVCVVCFYSFLSN